MTEFGFARHHHVSCEHCAANAAVYFTAEIILKEIYCRSDISLLAFVLFAMVIGFACQGIQMTLICLLSIGLIMAAFSDKATE